MIARILGLGGGFCWLIVVLTHVAERQHLLPGMGWGLPDSPGHYLDLGSAAAGTVLILAAVFVRRLASAKPPSATVTSKRGRRA